MSAPLIVVALGRFHVVLAAAANLCDLLIIGLNVNLKKYYCMSSLISRTFKGKF